MVLHETLPSEAELAAIMSSETADLNLFQACAAHFATDAALLGANSDEVLSSLVVSFAALKSAKAVAPPELPPALAKQIMGHLVEDVEAKGGSLFKKLADQPEVEDAVVDIFMEEMLENVRGWRGIGKHTPEPPSRRCFRDGQLFDVFFFYSGWPFSERVAGINAAASDGSGGADAMDGATASAAAAATAAAAEGRSFKVAIIGGGASGLCAAIKLKQAGIDFVIIERATKVGGVW